MPLPVIIAAIIKFVGIGLFFAAVDAIVSMFDNDEQEPTLAEYEAILRDQGGVPAADAAQARQMAENMPTAPWMLTAGGIAAFSNVTSTNPSVQAKINTAPDNQFKQLSARLSKVAASGSKPGVVGKVLSGASGKLTLAMFAIGLLWNIPEGIFGWGSRQLNYLMDLMGIPEEFRVPVEPGQFNPPGFNSNAFRNIFDDLAARGAVELFDPIKFVTMPYTAENLGQVMTALHVRRSFDGESTFPNDILNDLQNWVKDAQGQSIAGAPTPSTTPPPTGTTGPGTQFERPTEPATFPNRPKLFIGTIYSGRVTTPSQFTRNADDMILSDQDLLEDAEQNLTRWIAAMPNLLTYEVQLQFDPFDMDNVKRPGYWAVLALYMNTKLGRRQWITNILLGPIDPSRYFPTGHQLLQTQEVLGGFGGAQVQIPSPGTSPTQPSTGTPPSTSPPPSTTAPPTGPFTPAPPSTPPPTSGPLTPVPSTPPPPAETPTPVPETPTPPPPAPLPPPNQSLPEAIGYQPARGPHGVAGTRHGPFFATASEAIQWVDNIGRPQTGGEWGVQALTDTSQIQTVDPQWQAPQTSLPTPEAPPMTLPQGGQSLIPMTVTVNVDELMVRSGPDTAFPLSGSQRLVRGDEVLVVGWIRGQQVGAEDRWWISQFGNFFWSGGTAEKPPS